MTELCKIALKYGTDKCPQLGHVYTPYYFKLFKGRQESIKKVLEIGVANQVRMRHIPNYTTGASLRMWRDFFPNAQVYGLDIDPKTMFEDKRIKTFFCDATSEEALEKVIEEIGTDIDLVIDDGNHHIESQVKTCRILKSLLKRDVIYIIEDVAYSKILSEELSRDYDIEVPYLRGRVELAQKMAELKAGPTKNFTKLVVVKSRLTQAETSRKMKNLLIWVSDKKRFNEEASVLVKIQIDNSLRLGWHPEDFLLVTNFPYEYNGVKATLTKDENYCAVRPRSINTATIPALIDEGIIEDGYIYWDHDMDAYQLQPIDDEELGLDGFDAGLTNYGWKPRLCMGSFFVKVSSKDIFEKAKPIIYSDVEDEDAVADILGADSALAERVKMMNITYNLGMRRVPENIERATKPIKIAHFHPNRPGLLEIFKPLMPYELVKIFAKHGYA